MVGTVPVARRGPATPAGLPYGAEAVALLPIFDLDGTLLDSDEALVQPFLDLGVARDRITFGPPVRSECERLGVPVAEYVRRYRPDRAPPFPGVDDLLGRLGRWALCSNKHPDQAARDLALRGWQPDVALFSDAFGWEPKQLGPVLDRLGCDASEVLFVGDTGHDRASAATVGCRFALAGWNPRAVPAAGDLVVSRPLDVLALLEGPA
jgi:phosphoglycolate phosphatase-like HAD superfamily hydrolase